MSEWAQKEVCQTFSSVFRLNFKFKRECEIMKIYPENCANLLN